MEKMAIIFETDDKKSIVGPMTTVEIVKFLAEHGFRMTHQGNRWKRQKEAEFGETVAEILPLLAIEEASIPQSDFTPQEILDLLGDLGGK